ncbi:hypothetical protein AB0B28_20210 [Glycomyces sp. NPDC046736]|uniref:hypothetical protein n=1 Tax=Glycomyces sp. NPDC046736 TaxID=3155615 RepID=UPI00340D8F72
MWTQHPAVIMAAQWVVSIAAAMTLAAIILTIVTGSYWAALFITSRIVPVVNEEGYPLEGVAALRHTHYRLKVWLGRVSFFPFRNDRSWLRMLRFHFILITLIAFGDFFVIAIDEGGRPLHESLAAVLGLPLLMHAGATFTAKTNARTGYAKRQGSGPVTRHRFFTDEEIEERIAAEERQREATERFWAS